MTEPEQAAPVRVGCVADLPPGSVRIVPVGRFGVAVYNVNGRFYALNNFCPHMGAELGRGPITGTTVAAEPYQRTYCRDGEIVRCPWHGWEFDIKTGETLAGRVRRVQTFRAWSEDGVVFVASRPNGRARIKDGT